MNYPYLNDLNFLEKLSRIKIQKKFNKIILLDFQENPIKEIQGIATAGSVTINGSSAVRRTVNLTLMALATENDLTDIDNLISINKKISLEVGIENPLSDYSHYGKIIWFPQGTYVLSQASCALSTSGCTITISGKDKMAKLDGTVGGIFPASIEITKRNEVLGYGEIDVTTPTMAEIIFEVVNHYGEEPADNIIISGLDGYGKQLIKYIGNSAIWFNKNYSAFITDYERKNSKSHLKDSFPNKFTTGENVGYTPTALTYPGSNDLVMSAGDTVASLLDKFAKVLGNFEYYYDVFGKFHFEPIENYKNNSGDITSLTAQNYFTQYGNQQYKYAITDSETLISLNNSPKLDNIKNDFIVWGGEKTSSDGTNKGLVKYHTVFASKPVPSLIKNYGLVSRNSGNLSMYTEYYHEPGEGENLYINSGSAVQSRSFGDKTTNGQYVNLDIFDSIRHFVGQKVTVSFNIKKISNVDIDNNIKFRVFATQTKGTSINRVQNESEYTFSCPSYTEIDGEWISFNTTITKHTADNYGGIIIWFNDKTITGKDPMFEIYGLTIKIGHNNGVNKYQRSYFNKKAWLNQIQIVNPSNSLATATINKTNGSDPSLEIKLTPQSTHIDSRNLYLHSLQTSQLYFTMPETPDATFWGLASPKLIIESFKINNSQGEERIYKPEEGEELSLAPEKTITFPDDFLRFVYKKEGEGRYFGEIYINEINYNSPIIFKVAIRDTWGEPVMSKPTEIKSEKVEAKKTPAEYRQVYKLSSEEKKRLALLQQNGYKARISWEMQFNPVNKKQSDPQADEDFTIDLTGHYLINKGESIGDYYIKECYKKWKSYSYESKLTTHSSLNSSASSELVFEFKNTDSNNNGIDGSEFYFWIRNVKIEPAETKITSNLKLDFKDIFGENEMLPAVAEDNWREELYRQAQNKSQLEGATAFEEAELLANWRDIFNPLNKEWKSNEYWNPDVKADPIKLAYWLEYIDFPKYSIEAIGRRTKVVTDENIKNLWQSPIPDLVIVQKGTANNEVVKAMRAQGDNVYQINQSGMALFAASPSGLTGLDKTRELIQTHMSYNNTISLVTTPLYYLDVNKMIHIENQKLGLNDNYIITQISIPLAYNGTMSITAAEVIQNY